MPSSTSTPITILHVSDVDQITCNGKKYPCTVWNRFVYVKTLAPKPGSLLSVMLKDLDTGAEVTVPRIFMEPYPKIALITKECDPLRIQIFETRDTDPDRAVGIGFVALKIDGFPDAKVPADSAEPAQCHAYEKQLAV